MESSSSNSSSDSADKAKTVLSDDTAPRTAAVPRERYGRFRIKSELGSGGFADVLLAHDPELDRSVAIKVPRQSEFEDSRVLKQFAEEARTAARLSHPNIVQVYDVGVEDGVYYIVLEYIRGRTLEQVLTQETLAGTTIVSILSQIAEALFHAHEMGFVHRDVKPANILMDNDDRPRVSDFGLAIRHRDFNESQSDLAGTVRYMSPEQARGESHRIDGRTDIWAMGVVLYRAITKTHPFTGGSTREILQNILYQDPIPPRQLVPSTSEELERICLKCLSRHMTERYRTARELAEDLDDWRDSMLGTSGRSSDRRSLPRIDPPAAPLIPRGLRAFGKDDSDFFLRLVPGPRDRDGLPTVLRFWKSGIETEDTETVFRVGLLYGPSGCGKSSLVKAGLLPRIQSDVRTFFADASLGTPEESLLRSLRRTYPALREGKDLSQALRHLRDDPKYEGSQKTLLIIDQFEQWLQSWDFAPDASLISALRQCDGVRVQCLILVRDDFWLPISRFMHALEVRIVEGQNAMLIDSFDANHAINVLREFGAAYQCLPDNPGEITTEQHQFLKDAVAALTHDGRLYPVRLAVFVEMFRRMNWSPESLETLGGPDGVGVAFLDSMFGSSSSQSRQTLEPVIRRLLAELMPATGQIKGPVRSYSELRAACGFSSKAAEFDETIRLLDGELRIITPASQTLDDPGESGSGSRDSGRILVEPGYQLTHDFLVPSIRRYLERGQRSTRAGRAMLQLSEQAEAWTARPLPRFLPSFWEWLNLRLSTHTRDWNAKQRSMMAAANRRVFRQCIQGLAVLVMIISAALLLRHRLAENEFRRQAMLAMDRVTAGSSGELNGSLDNLSPFVSVVSEDLRKIADDDTEPLQSRMRAAAALLSTQSTYAEFLVGNLVNPLSPPEDFVALRDALVKHARVEVEPQLLAMLQDASLAERQRFRVMCLLSAFEDARPRLRPLAFEAFQSLLRESATHAGIWLEALTPASAEIKDVFAEEFAEVRSADQASVAAAALHVFDEKRLNLLLSRISAANDVQYRAIMQILRQEGSTARSLVTAMNNTPFEDDSASVVEAAEETDIPPGSLRSVNLAMALWQLGDSEPLRQLSAWQPNPDTRTLLVHSMNPARIDSSDLRSLILGLDDHDPILNVALAAMTHHLREPVSETMQLQMVSRLSGWHLNHPDAETHSLSELLLRNTGQDPSSLTTRDFASAKPDPSRNWYINSQGLCMIVIRPSQLKLTPGFDFDAPDHDFAISATEITQAQMKEIEQWKVRMTGEELHPDWPAALVDFDDAELYCQRLSEIEGLPEDEWCYQAESTLPYSHAVHDYTSKSGYRIPTDQEWLYACRCGAISPMSFGSQIRYLSEYAWFLPQSQGRGQPVASLLPNRFGMFDTYGNVCEICFTARGDTGSYSARGGSFYTQLLGFRRDAAKFTPGAVSSHNGLRIARTLRP